MAQARADVLRAELQEELRPLIERAAVSRESRRSNCARLRQWYDLGTDTGEAAVNNKLRSHIDRLGSYLWSSDQVRFGVHLPPAARAPWVSAAGTARDEFRQTWADSGSDLTVSLALEWALVYGGIPLKVRPDPQGFGLDAIDPWDFGVTREDQPNLEDQDVVCHWYTLSEPQFDRWIQGHPREIEWRKQAAGRTRIPSGTAGAGSIIVSGLSGTFPSSQVSASIQGDSGPALWTPSPEVREPVYAFADVWQRRVYRDLRREPFEDWRVTTVFAEDGQVLIVRRNPILGHFESPSGVTIPSEFPFAILAPRPLPDYLWGRSELLSLIGLQVWRETQVSQMREVITRQLDPAKFFSGVADFQEAGRAMKSPGGYWGSPDAGGKMDTVKVEVGQEAFGMLGTIDRAFDDQSGIPPVAQGEQPGGVRANNQLVSLAGIGAGRIRHMALQLEATLSRIATLGFRIVQRSDAQTYTATDGTRFLLAQLPPGTSLKVSSHSASPIFAEQTQAKAVELLKAGAIGPDWFTELLDPPHREEIKDEARKLSAQKAQMQERFLELELEKIRRKRGKL